MKAQRKKVTLKTLGDKIARGEKIIGMECHDTPSAMMAEELGMDLLCVGSPGPMALFGHKSMNTVDFQEQLYFLEAVLRGASTPFICCNMPNTTACVSKDNAVRNASEIQRRGADGVHIEPHHKTVEMVEAIVAAGIPVIGHFGVQGDVGRRWAVICREGALRKMQLTSSSSLTAALMPASARYCWNTLPKNSQNGVMKTCRCRLQAWVPVPTRTVFFTFPPTLSAVRFFRRRPNAIPSEMCGKT